MGSVDRDGEQCEGLDASAAIINDLVKQEARQMPWSVVTVVLMVHQEELGVPASKVVVGGFSQGGALSLWVGLQQECAGVLSLSGYLPRASQLRPLSTDVPVLFCHGRYSLSQLA